MSRNKRIAGVILVIALLAGLLAAGIGCAPEESRPPHPPPPATQPAATTTPPAATDVAPLPARARFRVATTTSLYDTGLWGYLDPMFEKKYDVEVDILSLGSGAAFEYGKRGDVDAVTIHDKPNELKFVSDNFGIGRVPFAYNYFLIVGPASDPAGIKGMTPGA